MAGKTKKITVKRGRTKLTPEAINCAIALREKGFTLLEIANALHIHETTLYKQNWDELKTQLNAIKAAQDEERNGQIENSLYKRALGQKVKTTKEVLTRDGQIIKLTEVKELAGDVRAQEFYLTNRAPNRWKATPEETTGAGSNDGTIKIEIV